MWMLCGTGRDGSVAIGQAASLPGVELRYCKRVYNRLSMLSLSSGIRHPASALVSGRRAHGQYAIGLHEHQYPSQSIASRGERAKG